jgi:hypothetical protein
MYPIIIDDYRRPTLQELLCFEAQLYQGSENDRKTAATSLRYVANEFDDYSVTEKYLTLIQKLELD